MITKERYEMLVDANKKGANLAPIDFEQMKEYVQRIRQRSRVGYRTVKKEYKIAKHNSTVCGYPGRNFDWTRFCWDGSETYDFGDCRYSIESEHVSDELKGQLIGIKKAPKPYIDDCLIAPNCQYLHVAYNFAENATIYRVRPNDSMYAGKVYRGHLIDKQTAVKKRDGWYWVIELQGGE